MAIYLTQNGLKTIWDIIKNRLGPQNSMEDYITSTTTATSQASNSNISVQWICRTWKSGKKECWGTAANQSFTISGPWGPFTDDGSNYINFPANFFTATPTYCDISISTTNMWTATKELGKGLSKTRTQEYSVNRPGDGVSSISGIVFVYAVGE